MSGKVVKSNTYKNKLKLISLVYFDLRDNSIPKTLPDARSHRIDLIFTIIVYLQLLPSFCANNPRETIYCNFSKIFIAIKSDIAKLYELSKLA